MQHLGEGAIHAEFPVAFGRYLLVKRLSRGGMGEIFLSKIGELKGFEKIVIIKKILPQLSENEDFINRFIDEVQIAIKLNHVNIAQVFEAGTVDREYFLAIEYIEGRDLRRIIRRCRELGRRLPVDQCLYIARDLAAGLAYAHRRTGPKGQALSLVHCDISPPNIMVSYEGEVKIIDFGIARSALRTADSNPNVGFGKFGYMAPEQLLRGAVIDRRTDIYAAGVVLYELLTGDRLYQFPEGTDYRQMARTVCQGKFTPPAQRDPRVDSVLDAILCRALSTRPEDRYQFAEEFRDALQQKLYQMSPTISADTLSRTMEELFVGERQQESEELQQMRAIDAAAYREELHEAVGHTVTIARALEEERPPGEDDTTQSSDDALTSVVPQAPSGPAEPGPPSVLVLSQTSDRQVEALRPRGDARAQERTTDQVRTPAATRHVILYGLLTFLVTFGLGGVYWLATHRETPTRPPEPPVQVAPPPPAAPVAEPLPPPPPPPSAAPRNTPPLRDAAAPPGVAAPKRVPKPAPPPHPKPAAPPEAVSADKKSLEVDRKFQQVRREYLEWKKQFGARLEDRWQQILTDAALGRRDQGLSDALDALRKDMKQLKTEQR